MVPMGSQFSPNNRQARPASLFVMRTQIVVRHPFRSRLKQD
jgi:hypothetical protein